MNSFFKDIGTIERLKNGPLGCHISAYAEKLHGQGLSWQSGRRKLQLAADFSRWLKRNGVVASQVRAKHVGKEGKMQNDECRKMRKSGLKPGTRVVRARYMRGASHSNSYPKAGRIGGRGV